MDSPDLSTIDKASFLQGLQPHDGDPLHSTAVEEDLNDVEKEETNKRRAGREDDPKTPKDAKKRQRDAGKKKKNKKGTEEDEEDEEDENEENKERKRAAEKVKTRPVKNQQMKKEEKRTSGNHSDSQSQDESSDSGRRRISSSDEELDDDKSWSPSPKKPRMRSLATTRKSSLIRSKPRKSSSGSEAEKANRDKEKRKRHQGGTDLDMMLDAFLDFSDQYRETVESKAVRKSIDSFSDNVKDQLLEKISSCKELRVLKRENAKVGSLIHKKTQKLLHAKHELMRAEQQLFLLQKEKSELEVRSADLRRGHSFLQDIRELNRRYVEQRRKHPKQKETFGASSLAALLLETKLLQAAERDRRVDNEPKSRQKRNTTEK